MNELQFPMHLDNSMRKELVKCQKLAHYKFEMGLQAAVEGNVHLIAGKAFAKGLEVVRRSFYVDNQGVRHAVEAGVEALYKSYGNFVPPVGENKTAQRMAGALTYYFDRCPIDAEVYRPLRLNDKKWGIELTFDYEIGMPHPDTGKALSYCGNFDLLALDDKNEVWVIDEKTSGSLGEKWVNQWALDSQMTGYCWGAKKILEENDLDYRVAGAVINGIAIKKYDYDHQRVATFRQQWEIERWYAQMNKDVYEWSRAYLKQNHNMALDHACAYYNNPCVFSKLCKSANPERIIDGNYVIKFWSPLARD